MTQHIDDSDETSMRQARYTAEKYMIAAIKSIDKTFGEGYAKKNPLLVAAFMQTAAMCNHSIAQVIEETITNGFNGLYSRVTDAIMMRN